MKLSKIIDLTSIYLFNYNNTFNPDREIINHAKLFCGYLTANAIEKQIKNIYIDGMGLFISKEYLSISDIKNVLTLMPDSACLDFCFNYSLKIDDISLFNKISHYYNNQHSPIPLITRKKISAILPITVFGVENIIPELSKTFKITNDFYEKGSIQSIEDIHERLNIYESSTLVYRKFLTNIANSELREPSENRIFVARINDILEKIGIILVLDESKNYQHYIVKQRECKPNKAPEYLIFGAIGTKPNIGISDALDGTVSVISDDGDPLTYDRKIIDHLNWSEMEAWWDEININPNLTLRKRLIDCLDSPPEQLFFKSYFSSFQAKLGEKLPALIPQVYIAYDPMRAKDLEGGKTRIRQRIDFLMILPNLKRVIIEIDGKQHYAKEDGRADTKRYAEMVRVDRDLRLRGYEVYRFGGAEFYNDKNTPEDNAVSVVKDFFTALFKQHEII